MRNDELARLRILLTEMKTAHILSDSPQSISIDRFDTHAPAITATFQRVLSILSREGLKCTPFDASETAAQKIGIWISDQLAVYVYPDIGRASNVFLSLFIGGESGPRVTQPVSYRMVGADALEQHVYALIARGLRILHSKAHRMTMSQRRHLHKAESSRNPAEDLSE